jgi:thioesterase domain-containing protein
MSGEYKEKRVNSNPLTRRYPRSVCPVTPNIPITQGARFMVPVWRGHGAPLFLVHSVAGELTWLPHLAASLDPKRPVFGFAAPGLNSTAPFFASLEAMAAAYLEDVRQHQPVGPYLLGGYSMGGLVAYEMARQLTEAGQTVALLVLIDAYAPDPGGRLPAARWSRNGLLMQVVSNQLALQWGADPEELLPADVLRSAPYTAHSEIAARHLVDMGRSRHTCESLQPYLRRCQTLMRMHAELMSSYRPLAPAQPLRAVLVRAALGLIGVDSVLRLPVLPEPERAPPHRWESLLGAVDTVDIAQEHFLMCRPSTLNEVAAALKPHLLAACPADLSLVETKLA